VDRVHDLKKGYRREELSFGSTKGALRLRIDAPKVTCPPELVKGPGLCFHNEPNAKKALLIDPGHFDHGLESRNGYHDEIHEGQVNMAVSLLTRQMLISCAPFDAKTGRGVRADALRFSHWPGEAGYGDYELGRRMQRLEGLAPAEVPPTALIVTKGTAALWDHVDGTLQAVDPGLDRSVVLSVHADAPDFGDVERRRTEHPSVLFRRERPASAGLALNLYESVIRYTAPFYEADQRATFEGLPTARPGLVVANAGQNGPAAMDIDGGTYNVTAQTTVVAGMLRTGRAGAEVVIVEGFHMDGKVVGEAIQRELHDCVLDAELKPVLRKDGSCEPNPNPAPLISVSRAEGGESWAPVRYRQSDLRDVAVSAPALPELPTISYEYTEGPEIAGLKVSRFYKAYAQALVAGLAERYACPAKSK
jgi:hypothetical protein